MRQASAAVPGLTPATPTEIPSGYHLVTFDVVNAQAKGSVSLVYTDFALNKTVQLCTQPPGAAGCPTGRGTVEWVVDGFTVRASARPNQLPQEWASITPVIQPTSNL